MLVSFASTVNAELMEGVMAMAELLVKREIRKRGSFSEFARRADLNASSVSQIVNGHLRPYPAQVRKIVDALGWEGDPAPLFREVELKDGDR